MVVLLVFLRGGVRAIKKSGLGFVGSIIQHNRQHQVDESMYEIWIETDFIDIRFLVFPAPSR